MFQTVTGHQQKVPNSYLMDTNNSATDLVPDGSKQHVCEVCHQTYSYLSSLKRHMKGHTGERFRCHLCEKTFLMKYQLTTHLRKHQGLSSYSCRICGKRFFSRFGCTSHEKKNHGFHKLCSSKQELMLTDGIVPSSTK